MTKIPYWQKLADPRWQKKEGKWSSGQITILLHRDTQDPFARVPKSLLDDKSLSWKAKGILAYLLGKPQGWKAQTQDIVNHGTDGGCSVSAGLLEMRNSGYAKLVKVKDSNGRVSEWFLKVSDTPVFIGDGPEVDFPDLEKPDLEKPDLENRALSKNESSEKETRKKERGSLPPEAEEWNRICDDLPRVLSVGKSRQRHLDARRKDQFWVDNYSTALRKITASSFCHGNSERGWKATFIWLVERPDALCKVMEGNYDDADPNRSKPSSGSSRRVSEDPNMF